MLWPWVSLLQYRSIIRPFHGSYTPFWNVKGLTNLIRLLITTCWAQQRDKECVVASHSIHIGLFLLFPQLQKYSVSLSEVNIEIALLKMYVMCLFWPASVSASTQVIQHTVISLQQWDFWYQGCSFHPCWLQWPAKGKFPWSFIPFP